MPSFNHLHCHTMFSLLDGAANIGAMMKKAQKDQMRAAAITDHGNMFGAFKFVAEAHKHGVKPIVGCEFYLVKDRHKQSFTKEAKDVRHHQLFLAKDQEGYQNLAKLCSLGFIEGLYGKYPRIDKELVLKYHKGLIATTCCLGAEVPQAILNKSEAEAETLFKWWLDLFGDDYYIEIQRHNLPEQEKVNQVLLGFAKKYNVKVIASNDSHYIDQKDNEAHDILLCINTGELKNTPIWHGDDDEKKTKGYRWGFPNNEFYFKTTAEMSAVFKDLPQAIDNTNEIVDKITSPVLKRDILLPNFPLPAGFLSPDSYLKHITFEGAKAKYKEITLEVEERLNHELKIIETMGFAGYFLIVSDFIKAGRNLGVMVGPGRGSAAGSAVAFSIGITNIDPIKYSLLFERFLNPERVSMPDIDTDFDDEGRQKVIDYVVDKYTKNQVAQIVTYGSMAAKMSIKDVARVIELPLAEANMLAKLIPEKPGTSLEMAYAEVPELAAIRKGNDLRAEVLRNAEILEGSVRNSGIHAAGIIIAPDDITKYIPVCCSKETQLLITQFDGKVIEDTGMLKMDFLGLKTLTIIKDTLALVEKNHKVAIDIDHIPMDDVPTFALYQRGDTVATFQFESEGMRQHLKDLKPTNIEDLIAMNALYRPGPMAFIPDFINRKQGREKVVYPHPLLENLLKNTFGIMVYQEQIMQTAQILAGYSLGGADLLRRAMGKKDKEKMAKERVKFVKGAQELHQIPDSKSSEVFDVMEKFAEYGFNRSHSAAYSVVAYQTAYLKANYPAEYMACVLTHNMSNIDKITFFMDETRRMGIPILGPDINESSIRFDTNKEGKIRFGLGAIKGTGDAAVESIISERNANGPYKNIYDVVERVNLRTVNKKTFESLVQAGALDLFAEIHRYQYLIAPEKNPSFIEKVIKYGNAIKEEDANSQESLFGGGNDKSGFSRPLPPVCEPFDQLTKLKLEKEIIGFYLSGHPLDQYKLEIAHFCTPLSEIENNKNKDIRLGGMVSQFTERTAKNGNRFGIITIEDFTSTYELALFGNDYINFSRYLNVGSQVLISGAYKTRFHNSTQFEFKITNVSLLSEQRNKLFRSLAISIDAKTITEEVITKLETLFNSNKGETPLRFYVQDSESKIKIDLHSLKHKINLSNEFLNALQRESNLSYEILKY